MSAKTAINLSLSEEDIVMNLIFGIETWDRKRWWQRRARHRMNYVSAPIPDGPFRFESVATPKFLKGVATMLNVEYIVMERTRWPRPWMREPRPPAVTLAARRGQSSSHWSGALSAPTATNSTSARRE